MRRRKFLVVSSAAVASAGCIEAFGDEGEGDDEHDGTAPDASATVDARVEHPEYVVTTESKFSTELNNAVSLDGFDEPARGYVREAVEEGRADVDDPDDTLLEAVQGVRYVREGDGVYEFGYSLPEYVVSGEVADVSPDEVDEDRVVHVYDDIVRALGPDNQQIVRMRTSVVGGGRGEFETGEYRTPSLTDELEEFLEGTDYLAVSTGDDPTATDEYVELELSRHDPDEYVLTAERLSREELFDVDEVRDLDALSDEAAEVVRAAVEGEYRGDTLPDGFEDEVGDAYFLADDEVYRPRVLEPDYDDVPTEVNVEVVEDEVGETYESPEEDDLEGYDDRFEDAYESEDDDEIEALTEELWDEYRPDDGARFELSVTNTSDETVTVFGGAPAPFGVLYAETDGDEDCPRRLVWSEAYVENGHVNVGPYGLTVNSIGLTTEFEADEAETEEYEVAFPAGEYRVEKSLSVSRGHRGDDEESWTYPYTVVIDTTRSSDDEA